MEDPFKGNIIKEYEEKQLIVPTSDKFPAALSVTLIRAVTAVS